MSILQRDARTAATKRGSTQSATSTVRRSGYQSVIRCTRACCASRTQRNSDARSVVRSGSWSSSIHQLTITDNSMQTINSTVACHVSILAFTSTHAQPTLPSCVRLACAALARGRRTRAEKSALSKETPYYYLVRVHKHNRTLCSHRVMV